ncbi:MAG: WG repeat-containing protein [Bacteroidales bacterium]|nr:WG repeat-containing protein [Bacteroidales bacterium]
MEKKDLINEKNNEMSDGTPVATDAQEVVNETANQETNSQCSKGDSPKSSSFKEFLQFLLGLLVLASIIFGVIKIVKHIKAKHECTYYETGYDDEPIDGAILYKKGKRSIINPTTKRTIVKDIDWCHYTDGKDTIILFAKKGKRGFCNIITNEVIVEPTTYTRAWVFSEGLAAVEKDGRIGFVDSNGKLVIGLKFSYRGNPLTKFVFHDGHCVVADANNKIGVIDPKGNWIIKPEYDDIELAKEYAIVYTKGDFKKQIDFNGKVLQEGIIDNISNIYYDSTYINSETGEPESCQVQNLEYYEYGVGRYVGLINNKGQFITPPIYTYINGVTPTLFCAILQDNYSKVFIDINGKVISGQQVIKNKK